MRLRAAARGSKLSRRQVEIFVDYAKSLLPGLEVELVVVRTRGDIVRDRPISSVGGKGVFSKEVNNAVLRGDADIGVHSLKDLPSEIPEDLEIVMVPPRGPANDSLVPRRGLPALPPERLPAGSLVAAGSARRQGMLRHANPGLRFTFIRGNLDTRLARLDEGRADYLVVAEAGLARLGISRDRVVLPLERFVPSPGQGIIAVVARRGSEAARLLARITHVPTHREMLAERAFLREAGGGCGMPIGGVARSVDGEILFTAAYYGDAPVIVRTRGRDPEQVGARAAEVLRSEAPL